MPKIIRLEPSNIQAGQWCDRCYTEAAATYDLVIVEDHGVSTFGHGFFCARCDGDEDDV